ncbi:MAG: aldose epimerase family protein [Pseudomonadota bacterium]
MIFGRDPEGAEVSAFELRAPGISARVIEWGAALQELRLDGVHRSLVLGFADLDGYLADTEHVGVLVGRVANRLSGGRFSVEGRDYIATRNVDGRDTLHGGARGWGRRRWRVVESAADHVALTLTDPDGAEGFPGEVKAIVVYALRPHALEITVTATADAPTVLNPTHHHYFNLSGEDRIDEHELSVAADRFTALDERLTPTGDIEIASEASDWRAPRRIGPAEVDVNYILGGGGEPRHAATLSGGGIAMTMRTTAPGLQVYTGDNLPGGGDFAARAGLCLEPQYWPDAPNHPNFPPIVFGPGRVFRQRTVFSFARV